MSTRKPMTDSSNHLKHHNQNSKKISKKQPRSHLLSNGINTHEEEKMKDMRNIIQNKGSTRYNQIGMDKIESDSEVDEELDINLEDVKKSNNILEKNQDKIAEISHYLILKNKINAKNAFDVPMLNVKEMSAFNKIEQEFAWKNLSSALEAGAKIYGYRVDSVHSETYKILGGLNRTELDENNKQTEENGSNENRNDENNIRKKHESSESNTLEKNLSNINTLKYDLEFDVDPLFSKTSAKFDEAGSKGLLLNNISANNKLELLFDVQIPQKINDFEANKEKQTNAKNYFSLADIGEEKFMGMKIFEFKVCPEISAFKEEIQNDREVFSTNKYFALDSSASKEEKAIGLDKSFQDMNFFLESFANSEENLLDTDFPDQTGGFEENYCNQLTVINEENHFINEESNMTVDNFNKENEGLNFKIGPSSSNELGNIKFNLSSIQEKNFTIGTGKNFSQFIDIESTKWMGPDQWKIKPNISKTTKSTPKENESEGQKDKSKKSSKGIDFDLSIKENFGQIFNPTKKNNNTLGKSQESAPLKHQFLLPLDFHVDLNRLGSTFLRDPSINMFRVYDEEDQNPNYTNNNENYETFARNENYENADDEIINNVAIDDKIENNKKIVHKGQIPIKELKEKIWNKMISLNKWEKNDNKIKIENEETFEKENGYTFGSIFNLIPVIVGEKNSQKVSIQTCFVTMLHLANEKILKFTPVDSQQNDFKIEKEKN